MNNTPDNIRNMWEQAAEISESKNGKVKPTKPKTVPVSKPTTDAKIKSSAEKHAAERDEHLKNGTYHS